MSQKPRRTFTDEQKAEAVRIVSQSGKPVSQVAKEMGLTESALHKWVKQAQIDASDEGQDQLTSTSLLDCPNGLLKQRSRYCTDALVNP